MVDASTVPNVCFADHAATFLWLIPCSWGSILDTFSRRRLSLYDLGNTPDILLDHKTQVLASVEIQYGGRFLVHPSPDGLALRIFVLASETIEDEHDLATFADVPTLVVFSCNFSRVAQFKSIQLGLQVPSIRNIPPPRPPSICVALRLVACTADELGHSPILDKSQPNSIQIRRCLEGLGFCGRDVSNVARPGHPPP